MKWGRVVCITLPPSSNHRDELESPGYDKTFMQNRENYRK